MRGGDWQLHSGAAAYHFNCMDRSRGFGGHQFDGPAQVFSRPDFVRNCFNCGQPGHLARECQGRGFRGVGLHVDYFGRDVQQRAWPYAGIRPVALHPREAAFLLSRDDGPQGWQQQITVDFSDSRTLGYVGRDSGNQNIPFLPNRMGDRPRDRRTGWVDFVAPSNPPLYSRGSDESHRKFTSRRTTAKARISPLRRIAAARKDSEENDLCFRTLDNANSRACEEIKRGFSTEAEATNSHGGKVEFSGIKPQMERDNGSEFASEHPELQVVVSACSDLDVMRASYDNEAEPRSQGRDSLTHGSNAGQSSFSNTEKIDSDLENGEFVSVGDDDDPVFQQSFAELSSRGSHEKNAAIKVMHYSDLESVMVKSGVDNDRDVRSCPGNPPSLRIDTAMKELEAIDSLKRRSNGNGRDGAEFLPARKSMHQSRHGGVCHGVSQSNSSPAGIVDSIKVRNLDGEVDYCNDFSVDPSASSDIFKRRSDCNVSEVEFKSSDTNLNVHCNDFGSTLSACMDRELQRPSNGDDSSGSGRDLNMSSGWTGHHSNYWNNSHNSNECVDTGKYDSGGFAGLPRNANTSLFPRRSVLPELTERQFPSVQTMENGDMKEYSPAEQKVCVHMKLVPRARSQQQCTACQAEVGITLINESERFNSNNAGKVDVCMKGDLTPTGDKGTLKAVTGINLETGVCVEQYNIDARVEKLMLNFPLVQGREQESVADALMAASQRITEDDYECGSEGLSTVPVLISGTRNVAIRTNIPAESLAAKITVHPNTKSPGKAKLPLHASNTICWKFPTAGGDWRLTQIEKAAIVGFSGGKGVSLRKEVINMGVSICELGNCEVLDPRSLTHRVMVSQHRKLEVPAWACAAAFKVENSVDSQSLHYPRLTEATTIKNGFLPHVDSPCEGISTKVISATLKSSKNSSAGVKIKNESSATRGKELGHGTNASRKSGHTRVSRRKYETTNHNTASVTAQVVLAGSTASLNGASDFNPQNNGYNPVGLTYSFAQPDQQPDQQPAGDLQDICSFSGKGPAVLSKCSKNLVSVAFRRHELQLESGVWHYLDAAGHERGPFTLSALKGIVAEGGLPAGASVLRKRDNLWVPVSHLVQYYDAHSPAFLSKLQPDYLERSANLVRSAASTVASTVQDPAHPANLALKGLDVHSVSSSTFHNELPQFLGYTNGKLHEYVMKSFRGSFAGFFNDALDVWSSSKRSVALSDVPSLGIASEEEPLCSETISSNVDGSLFVEQNSWSEGGRSVEDLLLYRRSLLHTSVVELDGSNSSTASQVGVHVTIATSTGKNAREVSSDQETSETGAVHENLSNLDAGGSSSQIGWAWLPTRILTKVLRLLRGDPKSLVAAMGTCQSWKDCAQDIKVSTKHVDLSGLGLRCTDAVLGGLLGFGGGQLKHITLDHCLNVSSKGLERLLKSYPSIREVGICGCARLIELVELYPQVRWVGNPFAVAHGIDTQRHGLRYNKLSSKSSGGKREYGDDVNSGGSLDETRYRDKSTEKSESPGTIRRVVNSLDPLGKDVHASQMGYPCRDFKRLKENSMSGTRNGFCTSAGKHGISKRKLNSKSTIKSQSSVRGSLKGTPVSSEKADNVAKEVSWNVKDAEKNPEKAMARALRVVMEADSEHLFHRMANEQVSEGRGAPTKSGQVDFCTVQKKLKLGHYGGRDGVKLFKEDLLQPLRNAFRLEHDSVIYKTAGRLFKVAHQVGQHLFNLLSKPQIRELADGQSKALSSCVTSARTLLKSKESKDLATEKQRGPKRSWDSETGARSVKRKVLNYMNSRSDGDVLSRDSDLQGSIDRDERESRRDRMRRSQWAESEAGSSDEEDMDEALYDEDTETSGSDVASKSGIADELVYDYRDASDSDNIYSGFGEGSSRDWWGARMTKAAMVPPLTRKYEVIEEYRIVDDFERVASKMKVILPDDYEEKLWAAKKVGDRYAHLDVPELKECRPRKRLGKEVLEQEVYGIDPYTYNLLLNTMPADTELFTEKQKQLFIEEKLLRALNREVSSFTGSGKAPMEYSLEKVIAHICGDAHADQPLQVFCRSLLKNMQRHLNDKYVAYRKGLGVVCNKPEGFDDGDFVVEFFGEVYPPWRWYEKQDGIRALQKKEKEPAPEFYNIVFERPKGDSWGYDVLVVDAMHKANFASRLCHSCRPNCEAKVTAVNGKYMIGVYTLRKIEFGEELTFDYCCVTESKEEHDSSVCLCGSQGCKGSYLCYTGPGAYDEVLKECHGILDRHNLLLQACTSGAVTFREQEDLKQAGLGPCLLDGLPQWVIKYAAGIVSYLNFERQRLPDELMKAEMLKHTGIDLDRQDVEVQTEGVYNQRLQNLAITLDKVRHVLTKLYGEEASKASPPLRMLEPHELVDYIWTGKDSVVGELLQCMAVHSPEGLADLTRQIQDHNPPPGGDIEENLRRSLLWLRDTLRKVPATCMGRHDAAADLIHLYAYTKHFFTNNDYGLVDSPPILIYACDLGPKHSGAGPYMWRKSYSKNYVWGQLISWFRQTSVDPGASLVQDRRGCLMLPDISSCYARTIQHDFRCGYSDKDRKKMIMHMETYPQKKWTRKLTPELWNFKSDRGLFGSPMLDAAVAKTKLNKECMQWLKTRDTVFHGPWDED